MATGIFGAKSCRGGAQPAARGVLLQFAIALSAAAVYWTASRKLALPVRRAVLFGLNLWGSRLSFHAPGGAAAIRGCLGRYAFRYEACEFVEHRFCAGLPTSLSARRFSR